MSARRVSGSTAAVVAERRGAPGERIQLWERAPGAPGEVIMVTIQGQDSGKRLPARPGPGTFTARGRAVRSSCALWTARVVSKRGR